MLPLPTVSSLFLTVIQDLVTSSSSSSRHFNPSLYLIIIIISIQPEDRFWQEPEPSQATGMALAHFNKVFQKAVPTQDVSNLLSLPLCYCKQEIQAY